MALVDVLHRVLGALKCVSCSVFFFQTEHLPLQTQFKEREVGGLQHSNGLTSRRLDYEDENPEGEDGIQQMYPLYNQICYQDRSPGKHHQSNDPDRVYINPREHYV